MPCEYLVILRAELFGLFISPLLHVASFYFLSLLAIGFRFFIESLPRPIGFSSLASLCNRTCIRSPRSHSFPDHEIIRRRKKAWNAGNADVGPAREALVGFWKWSASYLFFLLICGCYLCFPLLLLLMFPDQGDSGY